MTEHPRRSIATFAFALAFAVVAAASAAHAEEPPGEGDHGEEEAANGLPDASAPLAAALPYPDRYGPFRLASGIVLPYPLDNVFRGFADCRRGRHRHPALDIGGVGPHWGLGTPIRSMARARVTAIGAPELDRERWGSRLTDAETTARGRSILPTSGDHPGYGTVWYFTEDYGRSRTGVVITTVGLEGRLTGHTITYMHLAAVHPSLTVGSVVEAGEEVGLMGGTAVLEAPPHVHVSVKNKAGRALDLGPLLGIGPTRASCRSGKAGERGLRARYSANAVKLMGQLRKARSRTPTVAAAPPCGEWVFEGHVADRGLTGHRVALPRDAFDPSGPWELSVQRTAGRWQPLLALEDPWGNPVWTGAVTSRASSRGIGLRDAVAGRRGDTARIALNPPPGRVASAIIGTWGRAPLPHGARYRVVVSRPCAVPPGASGAPPPP